MTTYVKVMVGVADPYRVKVIYAVADAAEREIICIPNVEQTITFEAGKEDLIKLVKLPLL